MEQPQKKEFFSRGSIRYTIFVYFTVSALVIILLTGMSLYVRLSGQLKETVRNENQVLLSQVNRSVDAYLRTIMKLSDSLYYGVIKMQICLPEQSAVSLLFCTITIRMRFPILPFFQKKEN